MSSDPTFSRLNRNLGGYRGQTIDIDALIQRVLNKAKDRGWKTDCFSETPDPGLWVISKGPETPKGLIYVSAGIHGDEPAGPLAVERLLDWTGWPEDLRTVICPCLNPTGFRANRRENAAGYDLNRQYLHLEAHEAIRHAAWIDQQPWMQVAICLHEDWESNGFYLYELARNRNQDWSQKVIKNVAEVCPIDLSAEIEGRPAAGGIVIPPTDPLSRPQWPEAFYLFTRKTDLCYTFEAPSDFELSIRVSALTRAVQTIISELPSQP